VKPTVKETESRRSIDTFCADKHALVEAELSQILHSDGFRQADRLRTFLSFVVKTTLAHPNAALKGYTIAVEAFGREASFDPQDPYIRNIAKDVRTSLDVYYGNPNNQKNGIKIRIPKGAYAAKFDFTDAPPNPSVKGQESNPVSAAQSIKTPEQQHTSQATSTDFKPTVAIIPLTALNANDTQQYYGEVFADDIINIISREQKLNVISRLSTSGLKSKALEMSDLREQLGADYILTGTYLLSGDSLKLHVEMVDTRSGLLIWSEQTTGPVNTLFEVSCVWAKSIVDCTVRSMLSNELDRASSINPLTLPNYTLLIAAVNLLHRISDADFSKAKDFLSILIERNTRSPVPLAWMAKWLVLSQAQRQATDVKRLGETASECTQKALDINSSCTLSLTMDGLVHTNILKDLDTAEKRYDAALQKNPNESLALLLRGTLQAFKGNGKLALQDVDKALQLSPLDPMKYYYLSLSATAALADHQYDRALELASESKVLNPHHASTIRAMAIAEINLGKQSTAKQSIDNLLKLDPNFSVNKFLSQSPSSDFAIGRHWAKSLREAGAPH